eukprot:CAMPEP_0115122048 /NCGR_PEP_ID=MMETSP0227-20121206/46590_1 /TAXON_ID=89957 /ORGANISM="Polarella glacialis, Strain CCMP 1383" /LENGTH=1410 /DNA_ID=CAMNT_0002523905 /DNA_START=19 /DNA_END=4251 /DNA_ORIENTATION=+
MAKMRSSGQRRDGGRAQLVCGAVAVSQLGQQAGTAFHGPAVSPVSVAPATNPRSVQSPSVTAASASRRDTDSALPMRNVAAGAAASLLLASRARAGRKGRGVARGAGVQAGGLLGNIKDFFSSKMGGAEETESAGSESYGSSQGKDGKRIRVSSRLPIGQPFCGEYEELPMRLNDRAVFKKMGLPANSQAVYLLHNEANQWAFTPHGDGRTDGWAFVGDAASDPADITETFSIWDGGAWVPDSTLQLSGPGGKKAVAEAALSGEYQPSSLNDVGAAVRDPASAGPGPAVTSVPLPEEVKPLSFLHWKAHWAAMQRTLIKFPDAPEGLTERPLPDHPGVRRGVLPNGMRYVLLNNAMPPGRFEAHIELHVGSIDEDPNEQGIAHMMEHVCFLGSRKRERLIGTGSRSNALTDFQHTIYHIHAPVKLEDGRGMYLPALEALHEIAFSPEMLTHRIEKERKAVLAEMQQVNDMEYRIETWTLSGLHETNKLGSQFPIGKEDQIKGWQQKDLRNFHDKWYYPGNATLYVVGDIEEAEMISGIQKVFEPAPARHLPSPDTAIMEPVWGEASADARSLFRRKIARHRPEQLHNFSLPMIGTESVFTKAAAFDPESGGQPWHGPLRIFRNELLEGLQVNFYAKAPVRPLRTYEDIRHLIGVRILVGVLQFRIVSRYSSNHAPVQIDHSDSFREGCAVTSITVNADPRDWRNALACVVQEVRAICDYGITESEMNRYMDAMLKDVQKGVQENDTVPSEDHLNFIMTSDVFDHVIMHPEQSYEAFREVAPTVTMEQVHATAKWMLGFLGYYGLAAAPPATAIVVCTPTQVFEEHSGQFAPFNITEQEIVELLLTVPDKSREEALNQVDVPESLLRDQLATLLGPNPVDAVTAWRACSRKVDEATGIVQMMLPNGAKVNYANTSNESQGTIRMLVPGGKSADTPDNLGAAMVGIRTISESGAVSDFSREQIELFAVSNLMSVHLDLNLEFSYVDASFTNTQGGLVACLELLHLLFQEPRWEVPAFVRAQQAYKAQAYAVQKSLEQSTMDRLMRMMYSDPRVSEARVEDLNKLTLAKVRSSVWSQLRPQDLEINLVADFEGKHQAKMASMEGGLSTGKHREEGESDEEVELPAAARERRLLQLEEALWTYLGSLPVSPHAKGDIDRAPVIRRGEDLSPEERQRSAHLEDSDERAVANIGGGAPNRWGKGDAYHTEVMGLKSFSWDAPNSELKDHPLYASMCLLAMREVINTRLFSTVRDSLGLSYDCSFELSMFDRLEAGWFSCTVSAHPSRIQEAVDAAKGVLQGVKRRPISELELSTARRTLMRRHETDLQSNEYWISLLTHLQFENRKDLSCIQDIDKMLKSLSWRDVQNAYQTLLTDPDQLFVSLSTAGPGASYISGGASPAAVSTSQPSKQLVEID